MSRNLLVVLLMATGIAAADKKPGAKNATAPPAAQKETAAVPGQTEKAPNTKAAQVQTEGAQPDMGVPQNQSENPEIDGPSETAAPTPSGKDAKLTSVPGGKALGMSVLGNQEAPTSLVIVPWKTSEVGRSLSVSPMLDDSRQPVDKEVFMRALSYYQIRSEPKP